MLGMMLRGERVADKGRCELDWAARGKHRSINFLAKVPGVPWTQIHAPAAVLVRPKLTLSDVCEIQPFPPACSLP